MLIITIFRVRDFIRLLYMLIITIFRVRDFISFEKHFKSKIAFILKTNELQVFFTSAPSSEMNLNANFLLVSLRSILRHAVAPMTVYSFFIVPVKHDYCLVFLYNILRNINTDSSVSYTLKCEYQIEKLHKYIELS